MLTKLKQVDHLVLVAQANYIMFGSHNPCLHNCVLPFQSNAEALPEASLMAYCGKAVSYFEKTYTNYACLYYVDIVCSLL